MLRGPGQLTRRRLRGGTWVSLRGLNRRGAGRPVAGDVHHGGCISGEGEVIDARGLGVETAGIEVQGRGFIRLAAVTEVPLTGNNDGIAVVAMRVRRDA